jgi:hypothetical protein
MIDSAAHFMAKPDVSIKHSTELFVEIKVFLHFSVFKLTAAESALRDSRKKFTGENASQNF